MTGLEAMAAWLGRRMHGEEWSDLDARTRTSMMEDARELLGLYDAERWRVPTDDDWASDDDVNYVFMTQHMTDWSCLYFGAIKLNLTRSKPGLRVMIADLLPLPPAPGGAEK